MQPAPRAHLAHVPDGEQAATILAVLPWLGVPVLASAALASAGHRLPGEVLPVVAFLPLVLLAYVLALRVPARWRAVAVAGPGWLLAAGLLAVVADDPGPGAARTFWVALAVTAACTLAAVGLGRARRPMAPLATAAGLAMVFSQGLDGWQTYLAVGNPFGWLPQPVSERVPLSRFLLETMPAVYPALKLALAVAIALAFRQDRQPATGFVVMVLVVCYAGLSPAMFSAANLLAR